MVCGCWSLCRAGGSRTSLADDRLSGKAPHQDGTVCADADNGLAVWGDLDARDVTAVPTANVCHLSGIIVPHLSI